MSAASWVRHRLKGPLTPEQRRGAGSLLGLLLLLAAGALLLTRSSVAVRAGTVHHQTQRAWSSATPTLALSPATRAIVGAFLGGYLEYLYGRASARTVKDATGSFARSLEKHPPLVPEGLRNLRPRVLRITPMPAPPGYQGASAIISDQEGPLAYRIPLLLVRRGGRELVDGLQAPR